MEDFAGNAPAPGGLDTHNLRVDARLAAGAAFGLVLLALGAPWLAASHPAYTLAIRGFFSGLCHQDPERSFAIAGSPVAVCVRCLGIYGGVATGAVLSGWLRSQSGVALRCFLAGLLLNGADVAAEALHLHGNLPLERFFLGALLGIVTGVLLTMPFTPASARIKELSAL